MPPSVAVDRNRLLFPRLAGLYRLLAFVSVPLMRVCAGLIFASHGWPKIQSPFARIGMVENLGFFPGVFWSYTHQLLRAAHRIRRTPGVYAIFTSNYGCGPDSFTQHHLARLLAG